MYYTTTKGFDTFSAIQVKTLIQQLNMARTEKNKRDAFRRIGDVLAEHAEVLCASVEAWESFGHVMRLLDTKER
jgi:hypothetical protein